VLWIDADATVRNDVASLLELRDPMGLVAQVTPEGGDRIPNAGVSILRHHRRTRRFLDCVWRATSYVDHTWRESAAVLNLLGYELAPRVRLVRPSPTSATTRFLPIEWTRISTDPSPTPRIVRFPAMALPERLNRQRAAVVVLDQGNGAVSEQPHRRSRAARLARGIGMLGRRGIESSLPAPSPAACSAGTIPPVHA